jgi:glycerol uptake facilitator protein
MQAYIGEVIGTMILIILGDGVVAGVLLRNSKAENSGWIVITFGWAMAVAIAVYCVGQFSGAHINPAVTISLAVTGQFDWALVPGYIIAQFIGAFIGGVVVWLAYLPHWEETEDEGLKLAAAVIGSGLNPLLVGLLVLGIGLSLGGPTGYAINPARDLGPRIAHAVLPIAGKGGNDWGYSWIPVVGPIIGGILGAVLFTLLF